MDLIEIFFFVFFGQEFHHTLIQETFVKKNQETMPEAIINNDEINSMAKNVIETIISMNEPYKHSDVAGWNDSICEQIVQRLMQMNGNQYKYIVSCSIVQKNGAGISATARCYWNQTNDQYFNIRWENKHLYCIVHLFIVSL